ncbi:MAG: N-acetylmuramoyl-L-alanine amidase [Myxococcaceae bacterium]|nr:N-acetylmuramoyl-L-alanine amidase [Myxococcaceae bacterium]
MKTSALIAVVAGTLLTLSCGVEPKGSPLPAAPVAQGTSPLEQSFDAAAREFQVPVSLLKSIAYVETRVSPAAGLKGNNGTFGIMAISDRSDWPKLSRAAALTAVDSGKLKVDAASNIRGAAAVLRELADASFRDYPNLSANRLGDWYHAVSLYPGLDSATAAQSYAEDVFLAMERGFEVNALGGSVVLSPTTADWREHAPVSARQDALKEYPGAAGWVASPNYTAGHGAYTYVLIHTMQGSYSGTMSWFQNTAAQVSSHYIVRSSDGQITQMVEHKNTAWHAQCYNSKSIGIEHEGYVQDPGRWFTDAMYTESAKLTRYIADRHGIPRDRSHIIGHVEVAPSCNTGGHTDPGSGWNWSKYMSLVNGTTPTGTTGTFIGTIYEKGSSANRVAGAVVKVGSASVTTGADGIYQFSLAPGSYTATVTKAGYSTNTVTRTVTAGAQIWGSMEINAQAAATGDLKGKVYAYNTANPADMSVAIAGATVTCNGQTATTGADGMYAFTLPAGTYNVTAAKAGFANNTLSRTVTAGGVIWGSVGLNASSMADVQAPQVAITFPADKASMDLAVFNLTGTASDDKGAVASVALSLNGGTASDVPVTGGKFSIEVKLKPGTNTIKVSAKDAAGNAGGATSTAIFNAGVSGFVFESGDETKRIAGATLTLVEKGSATKVSDATSDATGAFALGVMTVPSDYIILVKAPGYRTYSETVTAPDDMRLQVKVPMVAGTDGELGGGTTVAFSDPVDGSTVTTESVTVYGSVTGFEVAGVKVNGVTAELLGAGGFTATVPLVEGSNTIEAVATGLTGETASGHITVTRRGSLGTGPGTGTGSSSQMGSGGGCSAVSGLSLLALTALAPLLRRRRRD